MSTRRENITRGCARLFICPLRGHDPIRLAVGPRWLDLCLRCFTRLGEGIDADAPDCC